MAAQTTMSLSQKVPADLLRTVLRVDAASALAGGLACVAAATVADHFGAIPPVALVVTGLAFVGWAAWLVRIAAQPAISRTATGAVIALNLLWIVASAAILLGGWLSLTPRGFWTVLLVADAVAVLAVLEFVGLRRLE